MPCQYTFSSHFHSAENGCAEPFGNPHRASQPVSNPHGQVAFVAFALAIGILHAVGNIGFYYDALGIDNSDQTLHLGTYRATEAELARFEGQRTRIEVVPQSRNATAPQGGLCEYLHAQGLPLRLRPASMGRNEHEG
jgi:hypothetical protein